MAELRSLVRPHRSAAAMRAMSTRSVRLRAFGAVSALTLPSSMTVSPVIQRVPQPAPGEGARGRAPVSLGQAQNRRRYCHLERTVPEFPPVTEYRHRRGSDSADPVDTGDPTRSARVRARRLRCHP